MTDNKKCKGKQDRERVSSNDPNEAEYLQHRFPKLLHSEIRRAIKAAGSGRKAIIIHLEQRKIMSN